MKSDVVDQKFSLLFDWFDQDRDGQLTPQDLEATAAVFAGVAKEEDHDNRAAFHSAFAQWWRLLEEADTDGDGRISRTEFITMMQDSVTTPAHFENVVMAIIEAIVNVTDTDGDGVLSRDEYVALYQALGVPAEQCGPAFDRVDLDGDGVISHAEYRAAIVEFYFSTDPEAPGNHLLGMLVQPT
ncbi:EF-hand domain-containing protein [Streptomyces sp. CNQ085]|uniref:EF-hand domain-containing protein n=1 Tax=Streptomyces sp. CNQ085 TaxID=2886944 RepID=UPI001F511FBF|nr:EF-hand domain-containing protein [Streptomyces sp. CNQ085]MCI0387129.1 EF-hand domain-containing protein [Streptomyces sp. CNQ085]